MRDFSGSSSIISNHHSHFITLIHCSMRNYHHDSLNPSSSKTSFLLFFLTLWFDRKHFCWKVMKSYRERERHKKWSTVWTSMPLLQQFAFSFHSQWWREVIKAIRSALFCEFIEIHFRGDQDYSRGMMRVVAFRSRDIRLWVVDEKEKEKSQILSRLIDFWMVGVGSRLLILRW